MELQVRFRETVRDYTYDCINGASVGDLVVILTGALKGHEGTVCELGRGKYGGKLATCWRPEYDDWETYLGNRELVKMTISSTYGKPERRAQ